MPKSGYGYALYTGSPSSQPSDISGLSLWLKADAGVDTTTQSFVSQIVISGSALPESNGTFIRTDPEDLYLRNTLNPDGYIFFNSGNWYINDYNTQNVTYVNYGSSLNENGWVPDQEYYGSVIAKNTIIPEHFVSEVTLVGAGSAGVNGTYKRSVGGRTSFYKENGNSIYWNTDISQWVTDGFEYSNQGNFVSWLTENGNDPAPVGANLKYSPITYKVNSWADQSGNKLNMLAGSITTAYGASLSPANTTPYHILSSSNFNGNPSIKFDGLFNYMQTKATTLGNVQFSFFIVSKNYNTNTDNNSGYPDLQSLFCKSNLVANDGSVFNVVEYSPSAPYLGMPDPNDSYNQIFFTNSTNRRLYCGAFQDGFGSRLWINGSLIGTNTTSEVTNNETIPLAIGNASTGWQSARESLYGEVAEVIMYNRYLSDQERQQVEGYLNAKYAIY
jgi:hypothetical protein